MIRPLSAALLATSLFCAPAFAQSVSPAIAAAVADASRPDTDKERDAARKPAETVAFAGVKPREDTLHMPLWRFREAL